MSGTPSRLMGRCPHIGCRGDYVLRKDGRIRLHPGPDGWGYRIRRKPCPGSYGQPTKTWERGNGQD